VRVRSRKRRARETSFRLSNPALVGSRAEVAAAPGTIIEARGVVKSFGQTPRLGLVFQSGQLVPELTAEENVSLPLLLGGTAAPRPSSRPEMVGPARPWASAGAVRRVQGRASGM